MVTLKAIGITFLVVLGLLAIPIFLTVLSALISIATTLGVAAVIYYCVKAYLEEDL